MLCEHKVDYCADVIKQFTSSNVFYLIHNVKMNGQLMHLEG